MAEIREVVDGKVVEPPKSVTPEGKGVLDTPAVEPLENELTSFFGLETASEQSRYSEKLKDVLAWAKSQTDDHSPENIRWVIRDLEFKLGSPGVGEKIIDLVHQYIGLSNQKSEIDSKLAKMNPYAKH